MGFREIPGVKILISGIPGNFPGNGKLNFIEEK